MAKKEMVVNEIYCDRCPTYLGREILQGKKIVQHEKRLESKGPFSMSIGKDKHEYKDLCPRCFDVLMNLFRKAARVQRGRSRRKSKG